MSYKVLCRKIYFPFSKFINIHNPKLERGKAFKLTFITDPSANPHELPSDDHGGRGVVKDSGDRIVILGLSQNGDLNERLLQNFGKGQ